MTSLNERLAKYTEGIRDSKTSYTEIRECREGTKYRNKLGTVSHWSLYIQMTPDTKPFFSPYDIIAKPKVPCFGLVRIISTC